MPYSIFLSSTFGDFRVERKKLEECVPLIPCLVLSAKTINPSSGGTMAERLQKEIDKADVIVLLIGLRYGSLTETGKSWTETEIRYAQSQGKPIFCYIREHEEVDSQDFDIPEPLLAFIQEVEKTNGAQRYPKSKDHILIAMVIRDLCKWESKQEALNHDDSFIA